MSDRTRHAIAWGCDIVRYDRAGKWYLENPVGSRRRISIQEAVKLSKQAIEVGEGEVLLRRPGGKTFDRLFLSATASAD